MDLMRTDLLTVDIGEIANPPSTPLSAGIEFNTHGQPAAGESGGYGGNFPVGDSSVQPLPMMAAPNFNPVPLHPQYVQPVYMNGQAGESIYGQYLPYHIPAHNVPGAAAVSHQATPLVYSPSLMLPAAQYLHPLGVMNTGMAYSFAPAPTSAAPSKNPSKSYKKKRSWQKADNQQDRDQPYIKKPRNAYICFVDEQRQNVAAELNNTNNSAVNAVLGQRWRNMTNEEQSKYYKQAEAERQLHAQQHPNWSCKDNYGKRRRNCKAATVAAPSAVKPDDRPPPPDDACRASAPEAERCPPLALQSGRETHHLSQVSEVVPAPYLSDLTNATAEPAASAAVTQTQTSESFVSFFIEEELQKMVENLDSMDPNEWPDLPFSFSPTSLPLLFY